MNKVKLFIENFLVYGLGGVISKVIPLIMVPIVTRIMPNSSYFGISDLANTVLSFCSALAIMGMYDAMYRMFFEKDDEEYKKQVCSTAFIFTIITSFIVFVLMILLKDIIAKYFFRDTKLAYLVYITAIATFVGATNSIISTPTRMQNKRKIYLIANFLSPVLSYSISIPLLLNGHYIIALPVAALVASVTMEVVFWVINRRWFSLRYYDKNLLKQMLIIAIPLLPNFLVYWIFNSSDKVMITNILGVQDAGIYSVSSKLGNVSQLIYTAFAGGWQFFAFSTMKEDNQVKSNSLIFEYLGIISFSTTAFICALSSVVFKVLFTDEYYEGYIAAPYLFMAPLMQMLFQVAANQFLVIKKTWPNLIILSVGAVVNVILNLALIPKLGIEGASIATLVGYIISDIICVMVLCRMKLMKVSYKFILSVTIICIFMVVWRLLLSEEIIISGVMASFVAILFILLYNKDIKSLFKRK